MLHTYVPAVPTKHPRAFLLPLREKSSPPQQVLRSTPVGTLFNKAEEQREGKQRRADNDLIGAGVRRMHEITTNNIHARRTDGRGATAEY